MPKHSSRSGTSACRGPGTPLSTKRNSRLGSGFFPRTPNGIALGRGRLRRARRKPRRGQANSPAKHSPSCIAATSFCMPDDQRGRYRTFGFHLFLFSCDSIPAKTGPAFKQVAPQIGADIATVFVKFSRTNSAVRAYASHPGSRSWNPKTSDCGLVLHESLTQSFLSSLPCWKIKRVLLFISCEPPREDHASSPSRGLFRGEHGEWQKICHHRTEDAGHEQTD